MTQPHVVPAAGFSLLDATSLFSLATVASYPLGTAPVIDPFQLIGVLKGSQFTATAQGLVGFGTLLSTGGTVAVVVLGWQWTQFLTNYFSSYHRLAGLPFSYPNQPTQPPPQFDYGYSTQYGLFRSSIWTLIQQAKSTVEQFKDQMPLITIGYGPSAPLAQLAALDLQPGNSYNGKSSPVTSIACYAYSCPAAGDSQFAASYGQCIPASYLVNRATSQNAPVDLYPTVSGPLGVYTPAGQIQGLAQPVPGFVCPWLEREWYGYQNALNAAEAESQGLPLPLQPLPGGGGVDAGSIKPANPPGYDPTLAYNFTLLCSAVYSLYEHPGMALNLPEPYSWVQSICDSSNNIWAALFTAPGSLVVAFRGPDTWAETNSILGNQTLSLDPGYTGVLDPYAKLYQELRQRIRSVLQQVGASSQTVYLAGHCGGGGLASLALYDLVTNPLSSLAVGALYTYGAPPIGDTGFASVFAAGCGSKSYQIARPLDIFPKLFSSTWRTVGAAIALNGGLADTRDCFTYHTLAVYSDLLNMYAVSPSLEKKPDVDRSYQKGLESRGLPWDEVHKCVLNTAANRGRITFSWARARSWVEPTHYSEDGTGYLGVQDVEVQPGHELLIEAPHQQQLQIVARSIRMGSGSKLRVTTGCRLWVGELRADSGSASNPPRIVVVGADGARGMPGADGFSGQSGSEGSAGGNGCTGVDGGYGADGAACPNVVFLVGTIGGVFLTVSHGGAGGSGGDGGNGGSGGIGGWHNDGQMASGGHGGDGGAGGMGGNGGDGAEVILAYDTMEPGAQIIVETPHSLGGSGGAGGRGGAGGAGTPGGGPGAMGSAGTTGRSGSPSTVVLQQRPRDATAAAAPSRA